VCANGSGVFREPTGEVLAGAMGGPVRGLDAGVVPGEQPAPT